MSQREAGEERRSQQPKISFWEGLDDPTAVFTLFLAVSTTVLACFTFYLWRATERLVAGTEKSSERQLRAYISGKAEEPAPNLVDQLRVSVKIQNHGQTPAGRVNIRASLVGSDEDQSGDTASIEEWEKLLPKNSSNMSLHHGQGRIMDFEVPPETAEKVLEGRLSLFIVGYISYQDFTSNWKETHFRQKWLRTGPGGVPRWGYCSKGNEAT